ncbi:MAG: hypothetical protein AABZ32_08415 [Bacteroidota bacterium]
MSDYDACPHCGRKAEESISSNWFPVHTCRECNTKYCEEDGPPCPECGADDYSDYDKVYAD